MGAECLDDMIARMRGLDSFTAEAAKEAAPLVQTSARRTAAAGTTPEGKAWPPKKDGGRALEHAAEHVTAVAVGSAIEVTLTGPDVFHNKGTASVPERRVIPRVGDPIPRTYADAMREGARRAFLRITGGR
ncbi:MAG: uncharacterized protein JWM74_4083 [Myxococcaceae bacterium]|nr:uncharacterized protein [Myxococcaceae bacterium]